MANNTGFNMCSDEIEATYGDILDELAGIDNIEVEVCGKWLWVRNYKAENARTLRSLGLKFSRNKCMWYMKPERESYTSTRKYSVYSMRKVRETYGRVVLDTEAMQARTKILADGKDAFAASVPTIF